LGLDHQDNRAEELKTQVQALCLGRTKAMHGTRFSEEENDLAAAAELEAAIDEISSPDFRSILLTQHQSPARKRRSM
jgi:hypothetical protein